MSYRDRHPLNSFDSKAIGVRLGKEELQLLEKVQKHEHAPWTWRGRGRVMREALRRGLLAFLAELDQEADELRKQNEAMKRSKPRQPRLR